jgi:hypothetical protein
MGGSFWNSSIDEDLALPADKAASAEARGWKACVSCAITNYNATPMRIPPRYAPWLESLGFQEISYDIGGLKLLTPEELDEGQVGYSRSEQGESFCNDSPGSWKPDWLVIGYETGLGDPIFVDTSAPGLPVLAAMHGEGSWDPTIIATSLEHFAVALRAFREIAIGREYPVALEQDPLSPEARARALQQIAGPKRDEIDMNFWEAMLG